MVELRNLALLCSSWLSSRQLTYSDFPEPETELSSCTHLTFTKVTAFDPDEGLAKEDFLNSPSCTPAPGTGEVRWCKAFSMALGNWQLGEEKAPIKETPNDSTDRMMNKEVGRKMHSASHRGLWYISDGNQDTGSGACVGGPSESMMSVKRQTQRCHSGTDRDQC